MNYKRIAQLYALLDEESKKVPVNEKRIAEINFWLAKEFGGNVPFPVPPVPVQNGSWWDWLTNIHLPENWKMYITASLSAFVAFNSQVHVVSQDWQNAILSAAVALGFWAVNTTQNLNLEKLKKHLTLHRYTQT